MKTSKTLMGTPVGVAVQKRRCKVVELNQRRMKVRKSIAHTREEWLARISH